MIGSHLPITAKQARFYPSLFCFCLKIFWAPIFRQRLGWTPEPRRRFTLSGHLLFCTGLWGTRVALAIRPVRAGRFSLNLSGDFAVCGRRERFAPSRREGKRVDTKVSTLLNPVSFWNGTAKFSERRPLRKWGTAEDFFFRRGGHWPPISLPLRNARFPTATHTVYSTQARLIVPRNSFV